MLYGNRSRRARGSGTRLVADAFGRERTHNRFVRFQVVFVHLVDLNYTTVSFHLNFASSAASGYLSDQWKSEIVVVVNQNRFLKQTINTSKETWTSVKIFLYSYTIEWS